MFGGKVPIQRCLIVPQFPDVNESRIKNIFCVEIFFAAILCTTGRNHLRHGRTGILQIPGRQADCSDNQQHAGLTRWAVMSILRNRPDSSRVTLRCRANEGDHIGNALRPVRTELISPVEWSRSEGSRVGTECVSTVSSRWSRYQ